MVGCGKITAIEPSINGLSQTIRGYDSLMAISRKQIFSKLTIRTPGFLIFLGFVLLDGIALGLLPWLNISYGGFLTGFAALCLLRGFVLYFWLVFSRRFLPARPTLPARFAPWLLVILNLILLGAVIYGFYIEPMRLTTGRMAIQVPGLKQPLRIVQLSDIHVERTTQRERALPGVVASLAPNLIVITGDFPNESYLNDPVTQQDLRSLIGQLRAPLGIYGVNGNVDSPSYLRYVLAGLNIRLLDNEVIRIPEGGEHLVLVGLDYINLKHDEYVLKRLMSQVQPDDFTILLYHKPDLAYMARDLDVDLYLAGHTHGGQVRLPLYGALVTNSRYHKTFEMGEYHLGNTNFFVSRGLGFTGGNAPRVRFLAPPEIVVIDLIPK